ncbi:hypothetical protein [Parafrigoribacterium soli]|uniref:hypothetical protein n=1 Tax=Parafrigoribacterium soli TaxID=3144663 RepID=UPI0032EB7871
MIGAVSRWWRARADVIATFTVCVALVALSSLGASATLRVDHALDANWRGAYDILVTPHGQDFGGQSTGGVVDSNFVATAGAGGISLDELAKVRRIANVDVAAPIGNVGILRDLAITPSLYISDDPKTGRTDLPPRAEMIRATTTLTRETSTRVETLSRKTGLVALARRTSVNPMSATASSMASPSGFGVQTDDFSFQVPLGQLPAFPSMVIAVDPAAEARLWGARGTFLKALSAAPADRKIHSAAATWAGMIDEKHYPVQQAEISTADNDPSTANGEVVPLVVNRSQTESLKLSVTIQRAALPDNTLPADPAQLEAAAKNATFTPFVTLTKDASAVSQPFTSPALEVQWPGSQHPVGDSAGTFFSTSTALDPMLVGRPSYKRSGTTSQNGTPSFRLVPQGKIGPDGGSLGGEFAEGSGSDPSVGATTAYRLPKKTRGTGFTTALPAPLGSFTDAELADEGAQTTSYAPSGVYSAGTTVVTRSSRPAIADGTTVSPNLSGLDFITPAPGAFTDLQGGETLRGSTPIDAIRVRVGGITSYSRSGQDRVFAVASSIDRLGLEAKIVAGSSPQPVALYVPDYFPSGADNSDLGWVRQDWTTLGASVTVQSAMSGLTRLLVILVGIAVSVGLLITQYITGIARSREVAILGRIGWTRRRVRRRILAGYLPGVVVVVAVGATCITAIGNQDPLSMTMTLSITVLSFVAATLGAFRSLSRDHDRKGIIRSPKMVTSARAIALRHLERSPGLAVAQVAGLALLGLTVSLTSGALATQRQAAGATRLAGVVFDAGIVALVALGFAGALAAFLLTVTGRLSEIKRRHDETALLRAIGYRSRARNASHRYEILVVTVIALAATTAFATPALALAPIGLHSVLFGLIATVMGGLAMSAMQSWRIG